MEANCVNALKKCRKDYSKAKIKCLAMGVLGTFIATRGIYGYGMCSLGEYMIDGLLDAKIAK